MEQQDGGPEPLLIPADEAEPAADLACGGGAGRAPARARQALDSIMRQPEAAALLVSALVVVLLLLGMGAGHARSQRQLADLCQQLGARVAALAAVDEQAHRQLAGLAASQRRLREQAEATSSALQQARARWEGVADGASATMVQLAELRTEVQRLRASGAAAAPTAGLTATAPGQLAAAEQAARKVAAAEAAAAIDRFAADRTGLPDYALAAAGGRVVGHSPALPPGLASQLAGGGMAPKGWLAPLLSARGDKAHPQASTVSAGRGRAVAPLQLVPLPLLPPPHRPNAPPPTTRCSSCWHRPPRPVPACRWPRAAPRRGTWTCSWRQRCAPPP